MSRRLGLLAAVLAVIAFGFTDAAPRAEAGKIRVLEADTLRVPRVPPMVEPPEMPSRIIIQVEDDSTEASVIFNSSRWRRSGGESASLVRFGEDVIVEADEVIDGSAVAIGANVHVRGHVTEDAVAIGGHVYLEPGAVVEGDAVAIGGSVTADPDARILGDDVGLRFIPTEFFPGLRAGGDGFGFGALFAGGLFFFLLVGGVLLEWVLPLRMRGVVEQIRLQLWPSFFAGLAAQVLFLPLLLLLLVTVIGIPVAVLLPFAAILVQVIGMIAIAVLLGSRLLGGRFDARGEWLRALAVGLALIFGITVISFLISRFGGVLGSIGGLVLLSVLAGHWTISTIGTGAVLLGRFGSRRPRTRDGGPVPPAPRDPRRPSEDPFRDPFPDPLDPRSDPGRLPPGGATQGA